MFHTPTQAAALRIPLRESVERELTDAERMRYARQLTMPEIGVEGQLRLAHARVLVVGAGGLGSPVIDYLGRAGVGEIVIVDDDTVAASNLHRQTLHGQSRVGMSKAHSAAAHLAEANPLVRAVVHEARLTASNVDALVADVDLVIDGTDNYPTRYLIADATTRAGVPCVWGAVLGTMGQASTFWADAPHGGVTLRDLYPIEPSATDVSCATVGVLGALCGVVASWMAAEGVKLIVGFGTSMLGRVLSFDLDDATVAEIPLRPATPPTRPEPAAPPAGESAPASTEPRWVEAAQLSAELRDGAELTIVDVRELWERAVARIDGSVPRPLSELGQDAVSTLPDGPLVVHCHYDGRARQALALLRAAGRDDVRVLRGGVDAWAREVDTDLARY